MKRGEIWMVDFGPPSGPEQAGVRPAVIVQDDGLSQVFATVIVVPLTTKMKRLEFPASVLLGERLKSLARKIVLADERKEIGDERKRT